MTTTSEKFRTSPGEVALNVVTAALVLSRRRNFVTASIGERAKSWPSPARKSLKAEMGSVPSGLA